MKDKIIDIIKIPLGISTSPILSPEISCVCPIIKNWDSQRMRKVCMPNHQNIETTKEWGRWQRRTAGWKLPLHLPMAMAALAFSHSPNSSDYTENWSTTIPCHDHDRLLLCSLSFPMSKSWIQSKNTVTNLS